MKLEFLKYKYIQIKLHLILQYHCGIKHCIISYNNMKYEQIVSHEGLNGRPDLKSRPFHVQFLGGEKHLICERKKKLKKI